MRSRPIRLTLTFIALLALAGGTVSALLFTQRADQRARALREFSRLIEDERDAVQRAQTALQASVAQDQPLAEWGPKVQTAIVAATTTLASLRDAAQSDGGARALEPLGSKLASLEAVDRRVKQKAYVDSIGASADVYREALVAADGAGAALTQALAQETTTADALIADLRWQTLVAASVGLGLTVVLLLLLGLTGSDDRIALGSGRGSRLQDAERQRPTLMDDDEDGVVSHAQPVAPGTVAPTAPAMLEAAASLCTAFGQVQTAEEVSSLLARAADALHARGIIVWIAEGDGSALRPTFAHGYSADSLARIPVLATTADNPTATAWRERRLQIVPGRVTGAQGAVVVPILSATGCIGTVSAEVRDRLEEADTVQAMATIIAAQFATVLAPDAAAPAAPEAAAAASDLPMI